jgi:plasmid stabilization system protein ParE
LAQGFKLHPLAAKDITDIWRFIASDSPQAAGRIRQDMLSPIRGLVRFPKQGHRRSDLTTRPLRFISIHEYLIAYAPDEKPWWIIAVLRGRRSPPAVAAILRNRE